MSRGDYAALALVTRAVQHFTGNKDPSTTQSYTVAVRCRQMLASRRYHWGGGGGGILPHDPSFHISV